ncbi:hypothetical protein R2A130_2021 [Ahrensia sp. R2A130]|nr:hypothetical protein R2A130_2021 [Ahrensia sp. R2A130]
MISINIVQIPRKRQSTNCLLRSRFCNFVVVRSPVCQNCIALYSPFIAADI